MTTTMMMMMRMIPVTGNSFALDWEREVARQKVLYLASRQGMQAVRVLWLYPPLNHQKRLTCTIVTLYCLYCFYLMKYLIFM